MWHRLLSIEARGSVKGYVADTRGPRVELTDAEVLVCERKRG